MEITARNKFDAAVLKLGSELHVRYRHRIFVILRYVYLLLIPLGIYLLLHGDEQFGTVFIFIAPILFLRKYFWQYRLIKGAKVSPHAKHELTTVFHDEGLHQTSKLHDVEMKWGSFCDRLLSPKAILLYPQKHQYLIFPRSAFATQEDFDEVSKMVREKVAAL